MKTFLKNEATNSLPPTSPSVPPPGRLVLHPGNLKHREPILWPPTPATLQGLSTMFKRDRSACETLLHIGAESSVGFGPQNQGDPQPGEDTHPAPSSGGCAPEREAASPRRAEWKSGTLHREARGASGAESRVSDRRVPGAGEPADWWGSPRPPPRPSAERGGAGPGEEVAGPVGEQGWGEQDRGGP